MRSHLLLTPAEYETSRSGHFHSHRLAFVLAAAGTASRDGMAVEVGCGPGAMLADFAEARPDLDCVGLDEDDGMVAYANEAHGHERLRFAVARVGRDPIPTRASFI